MKKIGFLLVILAIIFIATPITMLFITAIGADPGIGMDGIGANCALFCLGSVLGVAGIVTILNNF